MLTHFIKRIFVGVTLLFVYISALFFAVQILLPGDFVSQHVLSLSKPQVEALRALFGLDLPITSRYFHWLRGILHGDLGNSFTAFGLGPPVIEIIQSTLPATLLIFGFGTLCAYLLGLSIGKFVAWHPRHPLSSPFTFSSIAFYTSFPPWLVFLLIYFIFSKLKIPYVGLTAQISFQGETMASSEVIGKMLFQAVYIFTLGWMLHWVLQRARSPLTKLYVRFAPVLFLVVWWGSWWITGLYPFAIEIARRAILPILTYALLSFGEVMLIIKTTLIQVKEAEYILTARAKGVREEEVLHRHALRNAILPALSKYMLSFPYLLSGMVMIEHTVKWPGLGTTLFYAVGLQNVPLAVGILLFVGVFSIAMRLFVEVLQALLDPRLAYKAEKV